MFRGAFALFMLLSSAQNGTGFVPRPTSTNFRFLKPASNSFSPKLPFITNGESQITAQAHDRQSKILQLSRSSTDLFGISQRRRMRSNHVRFDTSTAATGDVSHDDNNQEKTIIRKVFEAPVRAVKTIFLFLLKLLLLKPFGKLKSILMRGKNIDESVGKGEIKVKKPLQSVAVNWDEQTNDKIVSDVVPPEIEPKASEEREIIAESKEIAEPQEGDIDISSAEEETVVPTETNAEEKTIKSDETVEVLGKIMEEPYLEAAVTLASDANEEVSVASGEEDASLSLETSEPVSVQEPVQKPVLKMPKGDRWAIAAPGIDLTGKWKLVASDAFKDQYDSYLKSLGQPSLVRSVAVSIVEMTSEEVIQEDDGRSLCIKGKNLRGIWDRTLLSSGSDYDSDHDDENGHKLVPLVTADKEHVNAEAWWENNGTTHKSWLRGVKKYGGGDFESTRFLDGNDKLICESVFHPNDKGSSAEGAAIRWEFRRAD